MEFVSKIDDAHVWARQAGVYRQVDLYHRGETLFMKWGGGYARLSIAGSTSVPKLTWLEIDPGSEAILDLAQGREPRYCGTGAIKYNGKRKAS